MKIYKLEIRDGVDGKVKADTSIAYCSQASVVDTGADKETIRKLLAESNPDQIDLYYLESVLVSTGWNKNDDVFLVEATWDARNTPEDKQFNFMHDENDIIGHITGSYIIDQDGNTVASDTPPIKFDIITQAVLYNSWTDPDNKERMTQIIGEVEAGKWFVSMECLFSNFDYALIDPQGASKLIQRDEASAFLTKHLRAYGGTGEYEGYKVGRALRNISFSGKGLVSNPANPRSIILNSIKAFDVCETDEITIFSGEINMSNDNVNILEQQISDLKESLSVAQNENQEMKKNIEEAKDKEFASTVQSFQADLTSKDEVIAELEKTNKSTLDRISELDALLVTSQDELTKANEAIAEINHKEKMRKRMDSLINAGLEQEEAAEALGNFDGLEDEAFEAVVSLWKKKNDKKNDEENDKKKKKDVDKEAEASEVAVEEQEATEETFDNVESSEATLVEASNDEDEMQATRASLAEWLSDNVLQSQSK